MQLLFCFIVPFLLSTLLNITSATVKCVDSQDKACARKRRISVSGLSSGADFAVQFHVAFSSRVFGSAIFAGQPFHCAVQRFPGDQLQKPSPEVPVCEGCPSNTTLPYDHCKHNSTAVDVNLLAATARKYATIGLIDDTSNLSSARVYLFRGEKDSHYDKTSVEKTRDFFKEFVKEESQLLYKDDIRAGHSYPLPGYLPYVCGMAAMIQFPLENCGYDGPGAALHHLYDGIRSLNPKQSPHNSLQLEIFDQTPYFNVSASETGFDDWGGVYVPPACDISGPDTLRSIHQSRSEICDIHINFHGCGFTFAPIYELLVRSLTFNGWAKTNKMIVLYPRLKSHGNTSQTRQGCWNVYGQSGLLYDTKKGTQMVSVMAMVDNISSIIRKRIPKIPKSKME